MTRDHGGNMQEAMQEFGGQADDWIDLSTGINRQPYPVPALSAAAWQNLPDSKVMADLCASARQAGSVAGAITPLAGAQAAIQLIPRLLPVGRAAILWPTYNEYEGVLRDAGWQVDRVSSLQDLAGADMAIVVNPNNPDGKSYSAEDLLALKNKTGLLVVDESFGDVAPSLSLAAHTGMDGLLVLKSFGKFFGLAGLRLGFACGSAGLIDRIARLAGPWQISGIAMETGIVALGDDDWANASRARLAGEARRIDALAAGAGWSLVGGTDLFRLYDVGDAVAARQALARQHIWARIFPWSDTWLRLGLPGSDKEWQRLEAALSGKRQ